MTVLWTVLTVVLVITSIVLHEIGHAVALREVGGRVAELGLFFGKTRWRINHPRLPYPVSIGWIPAGAYVRPHPDDQELLDCLPYRARAWYFGAGPVANLMFGLGLFLIAAFGTGHWVALIVSAVLYLGIWQFRRGFTAYAIPALGVALSGYLSWAMVTHPLGSVLGGPVTVAQATVSTGVCPALATAGWLSVSIGLLNMLPLWPLDGGWTAASLVRLWFPERGVLAYNMCTGILAVALTVYAVTGDLVRLVS